MQDNHENYDELNLRTIIQILPWLLLLAMQLSVAWFSFQYFGAAKYKAMELAKNPNNIREGCIFYGGKGKYGIGVKIENDKYTIDSVTIKNVPFYAKSKSFHKYLTKNNNVDICYKAKYIKVNIFPTHRHFIYDIAFPMY